MRVSLRSMLTGAVLAGGAAILAAGVVTPAVAGDSQVHVLTVQLPGGGVEQIQYTGDVAPRVVLVPASRMVAVPDGGTSIRSRTLERISALMDQQAAAMLRRGGESAGRHDPGIAARGQRIFVRLHDVGERGVHEKRADHL